MRNNLDNVRKYWNRIQKIYLYRRGLNPPHRVKSINMSTFTQDEVEFMKTHGNQVGLKFFFCFENVYLICL